MFCEISHSKTLPAGTVSPQNQDHKSYATKARKAFSLTLILLSCCLNNLNETLASVTSTEKNQRAAPRISLAENYHSDIDVTQYWVSEKLDGVRAYWDGKNLISRGGTIFNAPSWFTLNFPTEPLDGELWIQRGLFQQTVSAVMKHVPIDKEWKAVSYQTFDLPTSKDIFDSRLSQLKKVVGHYSRISANNRQFLKLIPQQRVDNTRQLTQLLNTLVAKGSEGLMLRRGDSYHHAGRNGDLLKYKPIYDDEATVVGYRAGKGKYRGKTGSLLVELSTGVRFYIGSGLTDKERVSPPSVGSVISFSFSGLTDNGIPRHARFLRIRPDAGL